MSNKDESLLGSLAALIPGYGAYLDQESRRADDRLTREFLVRRLADCKTVLDQIGRQAVERGDLQTPVALEKVRDQIDLAQRRLSSAVEGYAAWFGERTVDAKLLEEVANLDANLVSLVDQIDAETRGWTEKDKLDLSTVSELLKMLHQRIDRRGQLIQNGS